MGFLESLWKPKVIENFYFLHSILFNDQKMIVQISENSQIDIEEGNLELFLKQRENGQELFFTLNHNKSLNEKNIYETIIDIAGNNEMIADTNFWDVYIIVKANGYSKKYRLKCLDINFESQLFFYNHSPRVIVPYATKNGNMSFKIEQPSVITKIEKAHINNNGVFSLSGYAYYPSWDTSKQNNITKNILVRNENGDYEKSFQVQNVERKDLGDQLNWAGFNASIHLNDLDLDVIEGNEIDITIELKNNTQDTHNLNKIESSSIQLVDDSIFPNQSVIFKDSNGNEKEVTIRKNKKTKSLLLVISNHNLNVEIDTIFVDPESITINAVLLSNHPLFQNITGDYLLVMKKRNLNVIHEFPIKINNSHFTFKANLNEMICNDGLKEGVWDLFIDIEEKHYRISSRLDRISNKKDIISFPQQLVQNNKSDAVVVKPYYTAQNDVSLLIRNYTYSKSISRINITNQNMEINGKINIMLPNEELSEHAEGYISIKGKYGKSFDLPAKWKLHKTNKTNVEFEFSVIATYPDEKLSNMKDWILDHIKFDSLICKLDFGKIQSRFTLNISPEKIDKSFEDRLNKITRIKKMMEKGNVASYRILNKLFPIQSNTYIFQSYYGNSYACNPKAIYEEMLSQNKNIKAVWVMKDLQKDLPGNPILVKPHSFKYYFYMATAKYFVNNGNFPDFYKKRSDTIHVETWHGTPLKKLGLDVDPDSVAYAENTSIELLNRVKRWDYLIAPNHYTAEILKRAYNYNKKTLEIGYPRNDIFYRNDNVKKVEEIKKQLNIDPSKKVILYAPTWRDDDRKGSKKSSPFEFRFDLDQFKERFGDEYVLLLRLHYFDAARIHLLGFEDLVYNVTYYDDIQELYLISDILITDYSSVMFDYANLNRPIIFYTYDLLKYGSKMRGFYFDFQEEAPGPIVLSDSELYETIANIEDLRDEYSEKYENFKDRFCNLDDGHASQRAIEIIFEKNQRR
ncbi:CDP-glycerol glycerophosphotransferase family protein [Heyndrickxia sp. NPDC080065]|uniref:CDP-glycerol glycerophosphotransferase family protein n=1 Tax=Heyndrickxia sp. NPDC080065 TaxID=3390568 RepID=UPI003D08E619